AGDARNHRLPSQPPFGADLTRHACHFGGERAQLLDHGVEGFFELENFAAHVDGDFFRQIAAGDGGCDFGYITHLRRQVTGHRVDVVGQVFPRAGNAGDLRLAAEFAFGADLARHARHFRGEAVQLVDHRVDGVFQLENFTFDVHGDLA